MKNTTDIEVFDELSDEKPLYAINYCLEMLYSDKNKKSDDDVVDGLMYYELLDALTLAQRCLIQLGETD